MPYTPRTSGGGGGTPQLPAWAYTSGSIGSGLFTTDDETAAATSSITISKSVMGTCGNNQFESFGPAAYPNYILTFTDETGNVNLFVVTSINDVSGDMQFSVTPLFSGSPNWSGLYTLTIIPRIVTLANVLAASNITTFTQFLAVFSITPVADGTVTPVTSQTTVSGVTTGLS